MSIVKQKKLNNKVIIREGLWNVYKPKGVSSFDIVRDIKRMTGEKKVGHAGTLDPLAEGVLIVGVGREATKQLRFVLEEDKEYVGEIKLGMVSTTDDEEGRKSKVESQKSKVRKVYKVHKVHKVESQGASTHPFAKGGVNERINANSNKEDLKDENTTWPTLEEIKKVIQENFIGDIVQVSPAYSAIKIGGERAYKKARRGEKFTRPPRIVTIKEIEILDYFIPTVVNKTRLRSPASQLDYPILKIRTVVGSGTYIRSLAREIGEKLGTGGYLKSLVRTRIGKYKIENSVKLIDKK